MHFQLPPNDHKKLIFCIEGIVLDVALDLRKSSPTFMKAYQTELKEDIPDALYLDTGIAHGFFVLSENATLAYKVSKCFNQDSDAGIHWSSVPVNWGIEGEPITSDRDRRLPLLKDFSSPF
jgi:dTDP-4-dehydrorhamnose 3,5-epimerase